MNFFKPTLHHAAAFLIMLLPFTAVAGDKEESVFVRARIFNVPQSTADSLMAEKDFLTNVNGTLAKLAALVQKNEAVILANPSAQAKMGVNTQSKGLVDLHFEVHPTQGQNTLDLTVYVSYTGQTLTLSAPIKRGDAVFLGSFDPPKTGSNTPPGTNLVFIVVQ
jgi:hypothetical protein